jgi:dynein heavy chain
LIPTEDTLRYSFILNALATHSFPVLFIGETGTGKTSAIKKFANNMLPKEDWELG